MAKQVLNLLVIDEEQLYAEHLVGLLSSYYDDVNLGFLDDKAELIRLLRQSWDVLIFHRAYDMTFADVIGILQENHIELPVIYLTQNAEDAAINEFDYPEVMHGDMVKSVPVGKDDVIITAVCLQADYVAAKRQTAHLRAILKEAEQRANVLIANSKSAVAYIDQGVHVFANTPYLEMFGYQSMEEIIGVPVVDLIAGGDNVKGFKNFLRKFDKGDRSQVEFAFESKRTDGETFASKLQLAAATLDGEPVVQMIIQRSGADSAELAKKLAEAERQDSLTGLTNRVAFMEMLEQTYQDVADHTLKSASLIYVRIDGVGKISSSVGLAGMDTTVKQVAYLLDEQFNKAGEASVSRFSDTNFAVIIHEMNKDDVEKLANSISQMVAGMLIEVGSRTVTTSLSMGIVMVNANAPDAQTVLERAIETTSAIDEESSEDKVRMFDISTIAGSDDAAMAEYLQNAITNNQLKLHYQAIYDIETETSDLFEVYVTLPLADGTQMTFDKIIPIAKKHDLLGKIDRWVLINAGKHLAQVRQTQPTARILIGLSSATLADTNLSAMITQLTRAIGGGNDVITLQFNEQDLVDYLAVAKRQAIALANIECPFGIQSFGLTAKSADTLEYLSPKMVRLSKSYTKDLNREDNMSALQTLVNSANDHKAMVMIPYIEEASLMSTAWSVGARLLQGDYLQPASSEIVFLPPAEE